MNKMFSFFPRTGLSFCGKASKLIALGIFLFTALFFIHPENISDKKLKGIIVLKNGSEYKGSLIKITGDKITFEINGEKKEFAKAETLRLQFQKERLYEEITDISKIPDKEILDAWESSKKYKSSENTQAVIILDKTTYTIIDKNKYRVNIKKAFKILNQEGKDYTTQFFYYMKDSSAKLLYALTVSPDGKVSAIEESAINDEAMNNEYPEYDLLQRVKFGHKDADVGSLLIWEAEIERDIDDIKKIFFIEKPLTGDEFIEKMLLSVKCPDNIKINYSLYKGLLEAKLPEIKEEKTGNFKIISFRLDNVKPYINDEPDSPNGYIIKPKFFLSTGDKWENLGNKFYNDFFNKPISGELIKYVENITKDEKNDLDKLKKIYYQINGQINKAEISLNEYYITPSEENKSIKTAALSTLDKTYLFARCAKTLGIDTDLYFYNSNSKEPLTANTPSLGYFDSIISRIKLNNKFYYLSFDDKNYSFGFLPFNANNAYALKSGKKSELTKIEKTDYSYNSISYTINAELKEDDSLTLKKTTAIKGEEESYWREKRFSSKDELNNFMKKRVYNSLSGRALLTDYKFINDLSDFGKEIIFTENIFIKDFAFSSGKNIKLFKMPVNDFKTTGISIPKRTLPYDFSLNYKKEYSINIKIPDSYKINYLSGSFQVENDVFKLELKTSLEQNQINIKITEIIFNQFLLKDKYSSYKSALEEISKRINEWILSGANK